MEGEGERARLAGKAVLDLGAVAEGLFSGVELVQADGFLGGLVKQVLYQAFLGLALEIVIHHLPGGAAEVVVFFGGDALGRGGYDLQQFGFGEILFFESDADAGRFLRQDAVAEHHLALAPAQGFALADYLFEFKRDFAHRSFTASRS